MEAALRDVIETAGLSSFGDQREPISNLRHRRFIRFVGLQFNAKRARARTGANYIISAAISDSTCHHSVPRKSKPK
jgi:hypothetical protein